MISYYCQFFYYQAHIPVYTNKASHEGIHTHDFMQDYSNFIVPASKGVTAVLHQPGTHLISIQGPTIIDASVHVSPVIKNGSFRISFVQRLLVRFVYRYLY